MALNQSSSVYAIRNFPIGCGPVPHPSYDHHHHIQDDDDDDQDYKPFEDLDDLIEITDDISSNFGSGFKRKISAIRNFPPGCGTDDLGYGNGYDYDYLDDDYEELEYSNWFNSEDEIIEDEISASSPLSDQVGFGSDKDAGLDVPEGQESGRKLGVVLALVAPQFCPWRNGKGRIRKVKKQKLSVD